MWSPNLTSFPSPNWYFEAYIYEMKAITKKKTFLLSKLTEHFLGSAFLFLQSLDFHVVFTLATLYDVDPMNSLTQENV